ncbi:hypothetical protein ACSBR1_001758 [Camellia fascicularis]
MADIYDQFGNKIPLTDEHGHPIQLTDEGGKPVPLLALPWLRRLKPVLASLSLRLLLAAK